MKRLLKLSALATAMILLVSMVHAAELDKRATSVTVVAARVAAKPVHEAIIATGNVVAWRQMPISPEANGLAVVELLVDEGDVVSKGQVLARLNASILTAQIAQQKASITELQATLANAQSDATRARTVGPGVITAQTAEQRETLVKTATAKIAAARAALEEAEARLKQTTIVAPAAGLVASRGVTLGQVVQTGTEMFRLIQDRRIEVDAQVSEADLLKVKAGHGVKVTGPTGHVEQGQARIVAPLVDPKTRLGTVRIALGSDTALKPGMFARVEIAADARTALTVPLKALVWREAKPAVFKSTDGGKAVLTPVVTGRKTSDDVEITGGLKIGDTIVVEGAGLLNDGDSVRVEMAAAPVNERVTQ